MEAISAVAALAIPAAVAYAWWRKALLSLTLAVAMLFTFALAVLAGRLAPGGDLRFLLDLAVYRIGGDHSGPHAYVTALFLHGSLLHILGNLVFLVMIGPLLEERIGGLRWGVLFFVGGVVATLGFEALRWSSGPYAVIGASGALSAVFGAFGRLYPRERIALWVPLPLPPMPAIYWVVGFILFQFVIVALAGSAGGVAWEAHIIGLAFGFAGAPLVMRIPAKVRAAKVRDVSVLRPLVVGSELDEIYARIASETLPEAQAAWLERFARKAACPRCGRPLHLRRGALRSDCGWLLRLP